MIWTAAYLAAIVTVNVIFHHVPWVGSFIVGGIFLVRDFSQKEIGDRVLLAGVAGIALSYFMADPFVARASALAFGAGFAADFLFYRMTPGLTFRQKLVASQFVSAPLDTVVFLSGIAALSWPLFWVQVASKLAAVGVVVLWPRNTLEVA